MSLCLELKLDLSKRWTDMVHLYSEASYKSSKDLLLFFRRGGRVAGSIFQGIKQIPFNPTFFNAWTWAAPLWSRSLLTTNILFVLISSWSMFSTKVIVLLVTWINWTWINILQSDKEFLADCRDSLISCIFITCNFTMINKRV